MTGRTVKRLGNENGLSLIEIILLILMLGIAIPPLANLMKTNLVASGRLANVPKTAFYAQQRMEEVIADYTSQGYAYITAGGRYSSETIGGVTTAVSVSTGTWNSIQYARITVTAAVPNMSGNISLTTDVPQELFP